MSDRGKAIIDPSDTCLVIDKLGRYFEVIEEMMQAGEHRAGA